MTSTAGFGPPFFLRPGSATGLPEPDLYNERGQICGAMLETRSLPIEPESPQGRLDRPAAARSELRTAAWFEQQGKWTEAENCLRSLIDREPALAVVRFNLACFLRRCGRLDEALQEHQKALDLGIERPEEVLSNMAVIHTEQRRDECARVLLERALAENPVYVPARYNLALMHEEFGDKNAALRQYEDILGIDPGYCNALVRLVHARKVAQRNDPVFAKLRRALRRTHIDSLTRESLHFALGKAFDDCGLHDEAFEQYVQGNLLSAGRARPYDLLQQEERTAKLVRLFSREWLAGAEPVSERPLVFITGMFRSGSTLIEQVLASHPRIAAGGEIDYFHRMLERPDTSFPESLVAWGAADFHGLGTGYLEHLDRTFPEDVIVTNKRPDAFAYLGILKAMFPNARFIHTTRNPLDTVLSIWFQQLDDRVGYANKLENIAHHYRQNRQIMGHWKKLFGAQIHDVDYDDFVAAQRPVIEDLLHFLGLDWHPDCLEFHRLRNRVRTASVWQVREPVYRESSGRWRNYEKHLASVRGLLVVD